MSYLSVKAGTITAVMILASNVAHGHEATEVYIPIGSSPGVSKTSSLLGKISRLDYETGNIELSDTKGPKSVSVASSTLYYLDRSKYGKKSETGNMQDCKVGRYIEINVTDTGDVKWVKIQVD